MKKTFLLLALTLSGLFACSEQNQVDKCEAIIDDSSEIVHKEKTLMSSILTISDIIPLETNDSSLLGSIEKVTRRGNFIYIKSGNSPLMMFDKEVVSGIASERSDQDRKNTLCCLILMLRMKTSIF